MVEKASERESQLQNYIHSLKNDNERLEQERSQALSSLEEVKGKSARERRLAEQRKLNWHRERDLRRLAEDDAVTERKRLSELQRSLSKLQLASQDQRRKMKREWNDAEDQRKSGGKQKWPVWVVQLICELLVNGTSPTAIPANISTMYATLFGETVSPPGKHFCRRCRTVVQVAGETMAAIKLARVQSWEQRWTGAATRRQIPFTALIIGLMGDGSDDKIDPIVISSCIFMDDETSETCAAGIIRKVRRSD